VEFNAERGKYWMHTADLLRPLDADIVILNEMDIGMARSDQQHTTRLLAFALGMNYAWAVEFMELTRGTKAEQDDTKGSYNFLGLHGNAILSRCPLVDPVVFRDPIGDYFSASSNNVNAKGYEQRLGGRMALFTRVKLPFATVAVASVHKISGHVKSMQTYINSTPSRLAIVAGDQHWGYCSSVGLVHADKRDHYTWPASCSSLGKQRGDIICCSSSMTVTVPERSFLPCLKTQWGVSMHISDHAPTLVTVAIH
jgi:endonuclease/exonuclease/phosphatase family metal-dependent hydrolase